MITFVVLNLEEGWLWFGESWASTEECSIVENSSEQELPKEDIPDLKNNSIRYYVDDAGAFSIF